MSVARLPRICSWVNDDFPTTVWITPVLSVRNSTRPPLASRTALATSKVTVPDFGFGMSPRGPSTRPRRPTWPMRSGVAIATSKSSQPPSMRLATSSAPTPSELAKNTILAADLDAHAARGAFDHPHRGLDRIRVEVVHLDLGDRAHLRADDLPHLVLVRLARALLDAGFLSDEVGRGGALRDERVGPVLEDRHHRGHDGAGERGGALVVLLDELAHVDAVRAERRTDRRRRRRLAGVDLNFDDGLDLLRHLATSPAFLSVGSPARPVSRGRRWTRGLSPCCVPGSPRRPHHGGR